ncbi:MAG: LacI family DNA-binding transcriptional regulator [Armatimonadetes bacterium]|nr:LacI family DNA-binding transcriptional regulator [Armatimonadota bacterium]
MRRSERNNSAVTAKDIGNALGLSQPTVSRILTGAAGHRVAEDTRARVVETAARMGYRPNAVARSLRRRRTNIVGFYTGYGYLDARNAFLSAIIGSLQQAANARRMDILLHGVFRGSSTDDIYAEVMDGRVDGLFLHTHAGDPLAERLAGADALPVVAIADALPGIASVVCDDEAGSRALVAHLWERGHRRIGYIYPRTRFVSVERRMGAFLEEMRSRGAQDAPTFAIDIENTLPALEQIHAMANPPTAICCWNDLAAFDLVRECGILGMRVPGDLAVAGFDGLLDPRLTPRPLMTVSADWNTIAQAAMDALWARIEARFCAEGDGESPAPGTLTFPVRLAAGDTA